MALNAGVLTSEKYIMSHFFLLSLSLIYTHTLAVSTYSLTTLTFTLEVLT